MNIVFICGSLEQGKDGVGDYTRKLAGELIRKGNECSIIALMDKAVDIDVTEVQQDETIEIHVFRLLYKNGLQKNIRKACKFTEILKPDWIVLEYVPFSFNSKGLPLGLSNSILMLKGGSKLAIMFHEMWVGMNVEATLKLKVWGTLQKYLIRTFIKRTYPNVISTQSEVYQKKISQFGYKSHLVPLFSNIGIKCSMLRSNDNTVLNFVIFGNIYSGAPKEDFFEEISLFGKKHNKKINLNIIGRSGTEQKNWTNLARKLGINVQILGELSERRISEEIQKADFGVVITPNLILDKSGAFAAFNLHQIPVISLAHEWTIKEKNCTYISKHLDKKYQKNMLEFIINSKKKEKPVFITDVASILLDLLNYE